MNFTTAPTEADTKQFDAAIAALEAARVAVDALYWRYRNEANLNEHATLLTMPDRLAFEGEKLHLLRDKVEADRARRG